MTCATGSWTISFPEVDGASGPFEIRPYSLDYKLHRSDLDYARGTFDPAVGSMMAPETGTAGGALRGPTYVDVRYDDTRVGSLYFRPDFASYGSDYTHIEFQDLQRLLDSGVVDNEWADVKPKDAYRYAFEQRDDHGIIKGLKFSVPEQVPDRLFVDPWSPNPISDFIFSLTSETEKVIDSWNNIRFDQISPLQAIWKLNDILGLKSWVGPERYLWVGIPEAVEQLHIAAPDDDRIWRYNNDEVQIRHPREPIQMVTVHGAWNDAPGIGSPEDIIDEAVSWFKSGHEGGTGDIRATGIAYRTDVNDGRSILVESPSPKRDAVEGVAKAKLIEEYKKSNAGSVEIDPSTSGGFTPLHKVAPGHRLHLVPDDNHFAQPREEAGRLGTGPSFDELGPCESFVHNEIYAIRSVQHHVNGGRWSVTLDIAIEPDPANIDTKMRYFDPQANEYLTEEKVFNSPSFDGDEALGS